MSSAAEASKASICGKMLMFANSEGSGKSVWVTRLSLHCTHRQPHLKYLEAATRLSPLFIFYLEVSKHYTARTIVYTHKSKVNVYLFQNFV